MKLTHTAFSTLTAALVTAVFASGAYAQSAASETQRNVDQQKRIEQGLQSGSLNTKEAARLEKGEAHVEKMESNAMKDGKMTDAEKARIQNAQNKESQAIYREKHDAQTGNPNSTSSKRMQADVQRNINQQERINQGVKSGQLTNREAGKLEKGEARIDRKEARAGANGHVSAGEQARIQSADNRESKRIYRQKHDAQTR